MLAPPLPDCCGALELHGGDEDAGSERARADDRGVRGARRRSRRRQRRRLRIGDEATTASCSTTTRARAFSAKVVDVSRAAGLGDPASAARSAAAARRLPRRLPSGPRPGRPRTAARAAALDPEAGAARGHDRTGDLLRLGRDLQPRRNPRRPPSSASARRAHLLATGAELIAAGNPGCAAQLDLHLRALGHSLPVQHPIELLARAIDGDSRQSLIRTRAQSIATSMYRSRSAVQMSVLLRRFAVSCAATAAMLACALAVSPAASASSRQIAIIQDTTFLNSPVTALPQARALGARTIRAFVSWYLIAPHPASIHRPRFNASDPNGYPAANWAPYDQMVRLAASERVRLDLELTGGAPRWAEGRNAPRQYRANRSFGWWPAAEDLRPVRARGDRALRRPLHPARQLDQPLPGRPLLVVLERTELRAGSRPAVARRIDQADRAAALPRAAGRRLARRCAAPSRSVRNTVLIGETRRHRVRAAHARPPGQAAGRQRADPRALVFLRALYCVDAHYKALRGATAIRFGCPPTPAGSRRFRARNPALFEATGFADHPYASKRPPDANPATDQPRLRDVPRAHRVATALDRRHRRLRLSQAVPDLQRRVRLHHQPARSPSGSALPVAIARPRPSSTRPSTSATRTRGSASYAQFLLDDPDHRNKTHQGPGFASGLYTSTGRPKATLYAYRTAALAAPPDDRKAGPRARSGAAPGPRRLRPAPRDGRDPDAARPARTPGRRSRPSTVAGPPATSTSTTRCPTAAACGSPTRTRRPSRSCPPNVAGTTIYSRTVRITVTG